MRGLGIVICMLLPALPASAQQATPLVELSGGYSLVQTNAESWSGWLASASVSISRGFGVEVEAGRNYFSEEATFDGETHSSHSTTFFAGVGPRFVARRGRAASFAHVLLGTEKPATEYLPSLQLGAGGDFMMSSRLGVRGGIDGRITWYEEDTNGVWRFHVGIVIALGSR